MKQFDSSYETIEETNGVKYRYFLSRQGRQPTAHGIVVNTFTGTPAVRSTSASAINA